MIMSDENKPTSDTVAHLRAPIACAECGKPSTRPYYPFCSSGCRAMDLNRWLSGRYILPGKPLNEEDED